MYQIINVILVKDFKQLLIFQYLYKEFCNNFEISYNII